MTHDVTPPLSCFNAIPLHGAGFLRVTVTYQAVGLDTDPSEDREAAEHLLEVITEGAKEIVEELNEVIDTVLSIGDTAPGAHTKYGDLRGLDTDAAEATVKISLFIPNLKVPVEEMIFRVNQALHASLLYMWNIIDPEGYEAASDEAASEEGQLENFSLDGTTFSLN